MLIKMDDVSQDQDQDLVTLVQCTVYMNLMYPVQWTDILYSWYMCVHHVMITHVSYPDSENHSGSAQSVFGCRRDNPRVIASV